MPEFPTFTPFSLLLRLKIHDVLLEAVAGTRADFVGSLGEL